MSSGIVFLPTYNPKSVRTCSTCKHFSLDAKCRLFGKVSLVSGVVYTHPAIFSRTPELCGEVGMYWEPLKFKSSTNSISEAE